MNNKPIPYPESEITKRIKNERINRGIKSYKEYAIEAYGRNGFRRMMNKATS